jgi:hypothetical protein
MKKIKILIVLLTISAALFYSCSDSNPIENEVVTSKSIALRTTLNEIKKVSNISGKDNLTTQDQFFCFNFVYPITLSYNNGTQVTVATYEGLIEILTNENSALYVDGVAFPFQVQAEGVATTIHNEDEFFALIQECGNFHTVNSFVFDFTCYSIVYPISVINASQQTITVNNQTELLQLVSSPAGTVNYQLNIVFPISVTQNNQTIVIDDLYEFFDLNNDCASSSCICTQEYAPVCVQTVHGIVEFSNACHAECEGFTSADFVNCDGNPTRNFGQLLGSCFFIEYPAQVEAGGALVTIHNDGECLQYWNAVQPMPNFHYPLTVTFAGAINPYIFASQAEFQHEIDTHCN